MLENIKADLVGKEVVIKSQKQDGSFIIAEWFKVKEVKGNMIYGMYKEPNGRKYLRGIVNFDRCISLFYPIEDEGIQKKEVEEQEQPLKKEIRKERQEQVPTKPIQKQSVVKKEIVEQPSPVVKKTLNKEDIARKMKALTEEDVKTLRRAEPKKMVKRAEPEEVDEYEEEMEEPIEEPIEETDEIPEETSISEEEVGTEEDEDLPQE